MDTSQQHPPHARRAFTFWLETCSLLVVVLATAVMLFTSLGALVADNLAIRVGIDLPPITAENYAVQAATERTLIIEEPSTAQRTWVFLPSLLTTIVVLLAGVSLFRVVRSLRHHDPFTPTNTRLIALSAIIVLLGGAGSDLTRYWGARRALHEAGASLSTAIPDLTAAHAILEISTTWIVVSVLLAAVARFFRHGNRLRDDVDGLV